MSNLCCYLVYEIKEVDDFVMLKDVIYDVSLIDRLMSVKSIGSTAVCHLLGFVFLLKIGII